MVVGSGGRSLKLMVDRISVCNFVPTMGVDVKVLIMRLFSSFNGVCV